jgi:hypothetical protein
MRSGQRAKQKRRITTHRIAENGRACRAHPGDCCSNERSDFVDAVADARKTAVIPCLLNVPEKQFVCWKSTGELEKFERRHPKAKFDPAKSDHHRGGSCALLAHEARRGIQQARIKICIGEIFRWHTSQCLLKSMQSAFEMTERASQVGDRRASFAASRGRWLDFAARFKRLARIRDDECVVVRS